MSTIKLKRSGESGSAPGTDDLVHGELAINYADNKLYTLGHGGAIIDLLEVGERVGVSAWNGQSGMVVFNDYVASFNGLSGAVQGVSGWNGATGQVVFDDYVASFNGSTGSVIGVSSVNGSTGAVTLTDLVGVETFNGLTGAVTGVASFNGFTGAVTTCGVTTCVGGVTLGGGGATFSGNITAPTFVGDLTGDVTGTSSVATVATTVTITDNESTAEDNAIIFAAGGDVDGGNLGLESDGTLTYNPSTGKVTTTILDAAVNASALNINSNYALPTGAGVTGDVLMIANDGNLEFESLKTTATFIVDSDIPLATGIRYKGLFAVPMSKMDVTDIDLRSHDVSPAGSGDSLSVALKFIRTGLEAASPAIQGTVETVVIPLGGQYHTAVTEANVDTPGVGTGNNGGILVVDVVSNAGNHTNFTMLVTMEARP